MASKPSGLQPREAALVRNGAHVPRRRSAPTYSSIDAGSAANQYIWLRVQTRALILSVKVTELGHHNWSYWLRELATLKGRKFKTQ